MPESSTPLLCKHVLLCTNVLEETKSDFGKDSTRALGTAFFTPAGVVLSHAMIYDSLFLKSLMYFIYYKARR